MSECGKWAWQLSRYDERAHAFERAWRSPDLVEAACSHSAPVDRIGASHSEPRCVACMLIVDDHLAEHHRSRVGC